MEYQEIMTLLDHENTQPSRFRTKTWVEINDARREKYNTKNIKFKKTVLQWSLCEYCYI